MNGGPCCQWWCKEQVTEEYLLPASAGPPLSPLSQMPYKISAHIVVGQQSPWNADSKVYIKLSLSPSISSPSHIRTEAHHNVPRFKATANREHSSSETAMGFRGRTSGRMDC